jgi:DNA-binding NarL/FixJ family response regulator
MPDCYILLRGFNKLFAQWLQEKLNFENGFYCEIMHTSTEEYNITDMSGRKIIIQQLRHRKEIEEIRSLMSDSVNTHVIVWWNADHISEEDVIQNLNCGASAIISDQHDWCSILQAIVEVNKTGYHHNDLVTQALYQYCRRNAGSWLHKKSPGNSLGERERKIIQLKRSGKTSKEIGETLFLSKKTIDKIFGDLYRRFECNNFLELLLVCEKTDYSKSAVKS